MVLCPSRSWTFSPDDWMKAFGLHFVGFCWLLSMPSLEGVGVWQYLCKTKQNHSRICFSTPFRFGSESKLKKRACHMVLLVIQRLKVWCERRKEGKKFWTRSSEIRLVLNLIWLCLNADDKDVYDLSFVFFENAPLPFMGHSKFVALMVGEGGGGLGGVGTLPQTLTPNPQLSQDSHQRP